MKKTHIVGIVTGVAAVAAGAMIFGHRPVAQKAMPSALAKELHVPAVTKPDALRNYVEQHAKSPDKRVQDAVGKARMRLAYATANKHDYSSARKVLLVQAAKKDGTGAMSPEFGTISDQAAYQAAVCLVAEHKDKEAEAEFVTFLKERPLSPLAKACRDRLIRLNGGQPKQDWDDLMQTATSMQEAKARFEMSVCGPKALAYLFEHNLLKSAPNAATDYSSLAKICGTTDSGTTIEGLRKGLKKIGVESDAYKLNRKDFSNVTLPAIILQDSHYMVVLKISAESMLIYDPRFNSQREISLPSLDDPDFSVATILFSTPVIRS